jgi:uncharacterized membrane protein
MFALWLEGAGMKYIILIITTEALVELWKKAAPLQGIKEWLIAETPFLHSRRLDTHLLECPYCMSVWIGALILLVYVVFNNSIYLFGALAIHRVSNYVHLVISYLRDLQLNLRAGRAR